MHVPFCARRCSYCDFAIAVRRAVPVAEYVDALARECAIRFGAVHADPDTVDTLYFGGGTPSRLGGDGVRGAIDVVARHFPLAPDAELTLEANPDDVTAEHVAAWRAAGVNRLSVGAQSFDERVLSWMHRSHGTTQIERAVRTARAGGITNLSLDLIFAAPDGVDRDWSRDLAMALALEPDHLSLYGLTVEPRTPLGRWHARGEVTEADEERYAAEFLRAHDVMTAAGFEHYEVSNFARPGRRSRHNASYWSGAPYVGLGPSAHEFDGVTRRWNEASYPAWRAAVTAAADPVTGSERLSVENRVAERVYLGLRSDAGLEIAPPERPRVQRWVDAGWARLDDRRLRLTAAGWLRLDALAADLTAFRSP